jgi:Tol biopolymer transport system component
MLKYFKYIFSCIVLIILACTEDQISTSNELSKYTIMFDGSDSHVYTVLADGSNLKRVTKYDGMFPRYSPDGKKFAYGNIATEGMVIVVSDVDCDSLNKVAVLVPKGITGDVYFSWSPDGSKIVFNRSKISWVRSDIFIVDVITKELKQLTNEGYNFSPKWTPDGNKIIFDVLLKGGKLNGYIVNIDGSNKQKFPNIEIEGFNMSNICFSPDGNIALFVGVSDTTNFFINDIYRCDKDSKHLQRLTFDGKSNNPVWSPDGKKILFSSGRDGGVNLYSMNPDGSDQKRITRNGLVFYTNFDWTTDCKKIAYFAEVAPSGESKIRIIDSDGSNEYELNVQSHHEFHWKPLK